MLPYLQASYASLMEEPALVRILTHRPFIDLESSSQSLSRPFPSYSHRKGPVVKKDFSQGQERGREHLFEKIFSSKLHEDFKEGKPYHLYLNKAGVGRGSALLKVN